MTQEVDHEANIVQMISTRDEKIRELTNELEEAIGDKKDVENVLEDEVRGNTVLRVALRRKVRQHAVEIALRDERIKEVVGFCNEQTAELKKLQAENESVKSKQKQANPLPFALHMIMCAGISHYHNVVQQLAHGSVNRETNKVARALADLNRTDVVVKQPSLYRSVAMYCSAVGADAPASAALLGELNNYIRANIDLFLKDTQYEQSRKMLHWVWEAKNNSAHMGFAARNICQAFDWLPIAFESDAIDHLEDDDDYEELFCETLLKICTHLIRDSF